MKRYLSNIKTFVFIILSNIGFTAFGAVGDMITDENGIIYNVLSEPENGNPGTCEIGINSQYNQSRNIVIPTSVKFIDKNYNVIGISKSIDLGDNLITVTGFIDNDYIETLSFQENPFIQEIPWNSFLHCFSLKSVDLTGCINLKKIGEKAFQTADNLTEILLPNSVKTIEKQAFYQLPSIKNMELPASLETLGDFAFGKCESLESVTMHDEVTEIGVACFYICPNLKEVRLSDKIENIPHDCFTGSEKLSKINMPISIKNIDDLAFAGCNIKSLELPEGLISIGADAFGNNHNLSIVNFPNTLQELGSYSFAFCETLKSITVPDLVTYISEGTFCGCSSLEDVTIGRSVEIIDGFAFSECHNLRNLTFKGESLKTIGQFAFQECAIENLDLPIGLETIDTQAFFSGVNLKKLSLPKTLKYIGSGAFFTCGIESLDINGNDLVINNSFAGCKNLKTINIQGKIKSISSLSGEGSVFGGCDNIEYINVSDTETWCNIEFRSQYDNPTMYTHTLYIDGKELIDLDVPENIKSISNCAFIYCENLQSVKLANSVKTVGEEAFNGCFNLKSIILGESVSNIGARAFSVGLDRIVSLNIIPPIFEDETTCVQYSTILYIPEGQEVLERYQSTYPWSQAAKIFQLTDGKIVEPEEIILNQYKLDLTIGEEFQLEASVLPDNTTDKTLLWESSNNEIIIVNDEGRVYAISEGTASITVSCGEISAICQVTVLKPIVNPEQILLNLESAEIKTGETVQLEATVLPDDTTDKTVSWSSSNGNVASVDSDGLVTAVSEGSVIITATCGEVSAICQVTVLKPIINPEQILLNLESAEINIGETVQLEATVLPDDTTDKTVTWSSSNGNVASVDSDGLVTAISEGSVFITATCGEVSALCQVFILNPLVNPEQILLNLEFAEINIGETVQLEATVLPDDTTDKTVSWSSSNGNVASVDSDGLVTAISDGYAIITATCGEVSAVCEITVVVDAGVESLLDNPEKKITIYSNDGILIKKDCKVEDLKNLNKGIYIIISGKARYKISLK